MNSYLVEIEWKNGEKKGNIEIKYLTKSKHVHFELILSQFDVGTPALKKSVV
jgi:hypothetical protein